MLKSERFSFNLSLSMCSLSGIETVLKRILPKSPFYQSGESVKNPIKLLLPSSFWIATAIFPGRSLLRAMYFVSPVSVYVVQIARLRYELVGSSPFKHEN